MTDATVQHFDDWDNIRDQMLTNPDVRAIYNDCNNQARTCVTLTRARQSAGMTRRDVAARLAARPGMSQRAARRWVDRYEDGLLGGNAPIWLIHAYARAVGVQATIMVKAA